MKNKSAVEYANEFRVFNYSSLAHWEALVYVTTFVQNYDYEDAKVVSFANTEMSKGAMVIAIARNVFEVYDLAMCKQRGKQNAGD